MDSFISDKFRNNRGSWSRILKVSCKSCRTFLFHYQKDGAGPLKRSYLDRILDKNTLAVQNDWVYCPHCKICLGFNEPYAKEDNRPAVRWAVESIEYMIGSLMDTKTIKTAQEE